MKYVIMIDRPIGRDIWQFWRTAKEAKSQIKRLKSKYPLSTVMLYKLENGK